MKPISKAQADDAMGQIRHMKTVLGAEAEMLVSDTGQPRLVSYAAVSVAIQCAIAGGMGPEAFLEMVRGTVAAIQGETPDINKLKAAIERDNG